jgi:hypothetical protein
VACVTLVRLARHDENILAVARVGLLQDFEPGRLDHARQCADRKMIEVLVDEPLLDDVVGADHGDVRSIEDEKSAVLQDAGMILEHAQGMGQMLGGMAGMDHVELPGTEFERLDACHMQLRLAGRGLGDAFVGFHRHHFGGRKCSWSAHR